MHIASFIKSEFYVEEKYARTINPRSDHFKVFAGPLIKAVEEQVFSMKWFIKKVSVPDRPALISRLRSYGTKYFISDYKAFESHFTPEVLNACELRLYEHCLSWCPDVDVLCDTLGGKNIMTTREGTMCIVKGKRMSGDMNTSLGNSFTNLMLTLFVYHEKGLPVDGFVEGDDGVFASSEVPDADDYARLGFSIKIFEVDSPTLGAFCGLIFNDVGRPEILRDPIRFLMGFGWTHSFLYAGPKIMSELLRCKALSAVYETPQCPIIGAIARRALVETRHVRVDQKMFEKYMRDGYHERIPIDEINIDEPLMPSMTTRHLFALKYGISIPEQLYCEERVAAGDMQGLSLIFQPDPTMTWFYDRYVVET